MNTHSHVLPLIGLLCCGFLGAVSTGCATVRHEFHGKDAGQVWTAMQAVAQSPEYDDWYVMTNDVWADPNEARLEIYRVVERSNRSTALGAMRRWPQRQEWRFQVVLEETHPPTARFVSRGVEVPARADREGRRYFAEVRRLLMRDLDLLTDRRDEQPVRSDVQPYQETMRRVEGTQHTATSHQPPADDLHEVEAPDVREEVTPPQRRTGPDGLVEP